MTARSTGQRVGRTCRRTCLDVGPGSLSGPSATEGCPCRSEGWGWYGPGAGSRVTPLVLPFLVRDVTSESVEETRSPSTSTDLNSLKGLLDLSSGHTRGARRCKGLPV